MLSNRYIWTRWNRFFPLLLLALLIRNYLSIIIAASQQKSYILRSEVFTAAGMIFFSVKGQVKIGRQNPRIQGSL